MCIYIIPEYGLSNRLSFLCGHYSYNFTKKCVKNPCMVYMRWDIDNHCNGSFVEIFKLLPNLKFVGNDWEVPKEIPRYRGQDSVPNVYKKFGLNLNSYVECLIFGLLKFNNNIEEIAKNFIKNNFGKKTIGLHIRRTDFINLAKNYGNYSTDELFDNIIKKELDNDTKFYLATDNQDTQTFLKNKYPNNIIYYKQINKNYNLRQTTLMDAGIDLCLLSYCDYVEGSFHSSFTRVAIMFNLNRRKLCDKAEEELNKYFYRKKLI